MKLRRLLAGFVATAMTIGMIPALVLAEETGNEPAETEVVETTEKPTVKETEKPAEKAEKAKKPAKKEAK